ncbi:MAG: transglutaminase-like domain-containing protein, partial [Aggregatilineales bacterium]
LSVIRPSQVIERGESYGATSLMSVATANDLRAAGTEYPDWIESSATPAFGVTPRIAELATQIITERDATNNYDKAKAIESWLRQNITYNEKISAPPPGVDTMDWFLTNREGYCTYYATAMILMLRSQGIPARMAAGFAQGEFDTTLNQFVVRERDAHTWVEVFFPGYGWVEFEPTSAQLPLNRDGDEPFGQDAPQNVAPQPTQPPTSTPTFIPSPTAFPTSTPDGTNNQDDNNQEQPPPPPTLTATATATVTPVIVPTVAPPVQQPPPPPDDSFLDFLLGALSKAIVVALFIALIVLALFAVYWWWEWRGMGGLSPIARAFSRMERYMALIGLLPDNRDTPEEKRFKMVQKLPSAERPITAIARTYTHERYSSHKPGTPQASENEDIAEKFWKPVRRGIVQRWLRRFAFWQRDK